MAVLIEHYGGVFPVWLSPVQAMVIPVSDRHLEYARKVEESLREAGLRVEVDGSPTSMQKKIRENSRQKVPYLLVVGDSEQEAGEVNVRPRGEREQRTFSVGEFIEGVRREMDSRGSHSANSS
jgi:threonyl-tRNA synthetase